MVNSPRPSNFCTVKVIKTGSKEMRLVGTRLPELRLGVQQKLPCTVGSSHTGLLSWDQHLDSAAA